MDFGFLVLELGILVWDFGFWVCGVDLSLVDDVYFLRLYGKGTDYHTKSKMEKKGLFISAVSGFVLFVFFAVF